ncbi:MAG: hypothetical protein ACOYLV_15455 [Rubrivivax sp.]
MRTLDMQEQTSVAGGADWGQALVGGALVCTGFGGANAATGVTGGTVVGIGVVPVTAVAAVATGGYLVGDAIGNSAPVQNLADKVGTWLGHHGIVW